MNDPTLLLFAADVLVKSAAVMAIVWLAAAVWRQASATQRGCLWAIAFAMLFALPLTRLATPHWSFSWPAPAVVGAANASSTDLDPIFAANANDPAARLSPSVPEIPAGNLSAWLLGGWAAGFVFLLGYRALGAWLVSHRYRNGSAPAEACTALARSAAASLGIDRAVRVRLSASATVPLTWGTWRPVIMLPDEAQVWPREWREAAIWHEMAHVQRRDHLKRALAFVACALYWPNPLVWLAARKWRSAQEEASDNAVLGAGVPPRDYALQLVEMIRRAGRYSRGVEPAVAMARPSTLEARLVAILDETRNRRTPARSTLLITSSVAILLTLVLAAAQLRGDESASAENSLAADSTGQAAFNEAVDRVVPLHLHLKQVSVDEAIIKFEKAYNKAAPSLPVRWINSTSGSSKIDLQIENGSLREVVSQLATRAGLHVKIAPLHIFYAEDGDDRFVLHPRMTKIICNFWSDDPGAYGVGLWSRVLVLSDDGMRILHLVPDASGDIRKGFEQWGVQFPPGTSATCKPFPHKPKLNELTVVQTGDRLAEIFNLVLAANPDLILTTNPADRLTPAAPAKSARPDTRTSSP